MKEISAIPWNGHTVVSTFSGGGGSCLGYRMAGYRVAWANEFIPAAQETYKANHPNSILDCRDVRKVKGQDILDVTGIAPGCVDIFDGSPPCSAFSTAGGREKGWGKVKKYSDSAQRVDDLFFEYARILGELQPRMFIAENVAALVRGKAKGYFIQILKALKSQGYRVEARTLDAQFLGVPQMRPRLIFIGLRNDLASRVAIVWPKPDTQRFTLRDAIGDMEDPVGDDPCWLKRDSKGFERWGMCRPGESFAEALARRGMKPVAFQHRRLSFDRACNTITQSSRDNYHPTEPRYLSVKETARVMSIPDDFILTGPPAKKIERLGRMVPPLMMKRISLACKEVLDAVKQS